MTDKTNELTFLNDSSYVKFFTSSLKMIGDTLTPSQAKLLFQLSNYICYSDCILRTGGRANGNKLDMKDIASLLNFQYDTIRRTIYALRDLMVVGIHKIDGKNCITINPFICIKGSRLELWVLDYYADSIWAENNKEFINNDLCNYLRNILIDWKKSSMKFCDYKCIITGERFQHIHHITGFKELLCKTLEELEFDFMGLSDYSAKELALIEKTFLLNHKKYGYGVCLLSDIHNLFHSVYGKDNFTRMDFINFVDDIKNGKYNDWFKNHQLNININEDVMMYLVDFRI